MSGARWKVVKYGGELKLVGRVLELTVFPSLPYPTDNPEWRAGISLQPEHPNDESIQLWYADNFKTAEEAKIAAEAEAVSILTKAMLDLNIVF